MVIQEVCDAIWNALSHKYLAKPTEEEWKEIARSFWDKWNFPNCVGALDGKHILIQAPSNSGSLFFNYKKTFSIVLMATCDSNYCFTLVDVGQYGSVSDGGVFSSSKFGQQFYNCTLGLPRGVANLPGSNIPMPCCFVADEAFPLRRNLMRPYPGKNQPVIRRIFNYRLSRARRIIENTFGILSARWRIFRKPINVKKETVDKIVLATVCLHNFIKKEEAKQSPAEHMYCPPNFVDSNDAEDGHWRSEVVSGMKDLGRVGANRATQESYNLRDTLASYFTSAAGEVPWQNEYLNRGCNADG